MLSTKWRTLSKQWSEVAAAVDEVEDLTRDFD
jgi:hypothetical protein